MRCAIANNPDIMESIVVAGGLEPSAFCLGTTFAESKGCICIAVDKSPSHKQSCRIQITGFDLTNGTWPYSRLTGKVRSP
jgi:hypothetical protein